MNVRLNNNGSISAYYHVDDAPKAAEAGNAGIGGNDIHELLLLLLLLLLSLPSAFELSIAWVVGVAVVRMERIQHPCGFQPFTTSNCRVDVIMWIVIPPYV